MNKSVKSYTGLDPERCKSGFGMPDSMVMVLEALKNLKEMPEGFYAPSEYVANLMTSRQVAMVRGAFGKYAPKGYEAAKVKAYAELEELAEARGWSVTAEEQLAAHVSIVERMKGVEKWKAEQVKVRRAAKHWERENTEKVDGKWSDAVVYELPTLKKSEGKSLQHEDAQYAFKCVDGTVVDLLRIQYRENGSLHNDMTKREQGVPLLMHVEALKKANPSRTYFAPVWRSGPDAAMQSIAARLGKKMNGGAHTILQSLVGLKDVIPAYRTIWRKDRWLVLVAWQRDPKLAKSSYGIVNERVQPCTGDDAMTVSEFDYSLFTDYSDLEIEDGEEIRYDYEDDESYMVGFNRDAEPEGINLDQFAEDDDEMELLRYMKSALDIQVIELDHLNGPAAEIALMGEMDDEGKFHGGIKGCRRIIKALDFLVQTAPTVELVASLNYQLDVALPKWERMLSTRLMLLEVHADHGQDVGHQIDRSRRFIPPVIAGASEIPMGGIHVPIITEVDRIIPAQTLFRPTVKMLQRGTVGVCKLSDGTYAVRYSANSRKPYTTAKNANPALKATLERIIACG